MSFIVDIRDEGLVPFLTRIAVRTAITLPSILLGPLSFYFRPDPVYKSYIYKVDNAQWQGSIIMRDIAQSRNDRTAIQRLKSADIIFFEIHGGGLRAGNSTMYMPAFSKWIDLLKVKHNLTAAMFSVEYGLSPKNPYPVAKDQCLKAFRYLIYDVGVSPSKIIVSSDSAGSSLGLEMLIDTYAPRIVQNIHRNLDAPRDNFDIPLPAGAFFSSPLVTADTSSPSYQKNSKKDIVTIKLAEVLYKEYTLIPEKNFADHLPVMHMQDIRRGFDRFMPKEVLVYQGTKESFLDDVLRWVTDIKADNGSTNVHLYLEDYYHDWFLFPPLIKKKDRWILDRYTELMVDWAVEAVEKANRNSD